MSDMAFNAMMTELDGFSYDQCVALLAWLSQVFKGKKAGSGGGGVADRPLFWHGERRGQRANV